MSRIDISGASDDLIEIGGDIREEFYAELGDDGGKRNYLAFSDGTILSIVYSDEGIWRIAPIHNGAAKFDLTQGTDADTDYTDHAVLEGDVCWVIHGTAMARLPGDA